jgi:hypothetical protein
MIPRRKFDSSDDLEALLRHAKGYAAHDGDRREPFRANLTNIRGRPIEHLRAHAKGILKNDLFEV